MKIFKKILNKPSLHERVLILERAVEELSKKNISQTTTEKDEAATLSQILDEWLNGEEGEE